MTTNHSRKVALAAAALLVTGAAAAAASATAAVTANSGKPAGTTGVVIAEPVEAPNQWTAPPA